MATNLKPRPLSAEQLKLFQQYLPMAETKGRILARKYSRFDGEEIVQYAREGLWRAAFSWEYRGDGSEFEPYARERINWWVTKRLFVTVGAAALRHAREREIQGSIVVADHGKEETLLEVADLNCGDAEYQSLSAEEHEYDRYSEVLKALDSAPLTRSERQAVFMRYHQGLDDETIGRRLKHKYPAFLVRCAIRKLRSYFKSKGYETLPITAPLPNPGPPGRNA